MRYPCILACICELVYNDMSNCFNENFTTMPVFSDFNVNSPCEPTDKA